MTAERSDGALAGYPSPASGNRSLVFEGSSVTRTACVGSGRMPDIPHTRSEPVVGA